MEAGIQEGECGGELRTGSPGGGVMLSARPEVGEPGGKTEGKHGKS